MLPAVDFDYQFRFETDEIGDVSDERKLATEFRSTHLAQAQRMP